MVIAHLPRRLIEAVRRLLLLVYLLYEEVIYMHDTIGSKHITDKEIEEEKKAVKHAKGKLKHESAETLDEHQWHKHPGGG